MNQRGSVILWGLVLCGMIGVSTLVSSTYYESFARQAHLTQVRARLTSLESVVRTMAFQPYSYTCGADNGASAVADISSCTINVPYYDDVRQVMMPGAGCAGGPGTCGFKLTGPKVTSNGALGKFEATITYEGSEASIRPSVIELIIPTELLQSAKFDCALANPTGLTPVFVGFKADGSADCRGFKPVVNGVPQAEGTPCPKGTYATQVKFDPLTITCADLNIPPKLVSCGPGTAIDHVRWDAGVITGPCVPLPSAPF